MDAAALARLVAKFENLISKGRLPGAVVLLVRRGAVACFEAIGRLDPAQDSPMRCDSIFRIYSMTKPIVSVAVMQLFDEGAIRLDDPVARYLPAFAAARVGVEVEGRLEHVAPAKAMTIQDLLRHTAGLTYEFFPASAVRQTYVDANLYSTKRSNAEHIGALAALPLMHQPGSVWEYSRATDVLGRLLEVVSGRSLGEHLRQTIFDPLGMPDTGFSVPSDQRQRVAQPFDVDPDTGERIRMRDPSRGAVLECGGSDLVSTAADYSRFLRMLLQGGRIGDVRVLGRKTVELMTADHLGGIAGTQNTLPSGYGFGLGFAVRLVAGVASDPGSIGTYGWSGASGTMFFVDPQEEMFGVMLAQAPGQAAELRELFRNMACAAID